MKLTIGIPSYPYPNAIKKAVIRGRMKGKDVPLILTPLTDMQKRHKDWQYMRGMPTHAAHDPDKGLVWLHPLPNGEYELDITPDDEAATEKREIKGTITKAVAAGKR